MHLERDLFLARVPGFYTNPDALSFNLIFVNVKQKESHRYSISVLRPFFQKQL